jgi:hypothetical protein
MSNEIDWELVHRKRRQMNAALHPEIDHLDITVPFSKDPPEHSQHRPSAEEKRLQEVAQSVSDRVDGLAAMGGKDGLPGNELIAYIMHNVGSGVSESQIRRRLRLNILPPSRKKPTAAKPLPPTPAATPSKSACPECGCEVPACGLWKHLMSQHHWTLSKIRNLGSK